MSNDRHLTLRWPAAAVAAALLVTIGALGSYVAMRHEPASQTPAAIDRQLSAPPTPTDVLRPADAPLPAVIVTLTEEAATRAGIVVAAVETGSTTDALRLPAVVEPNAYKQVSVTPLVTGRVTHVLTELGAEVRQGQTMVIVFSPELAEAETRYLSASAELSAHERALARAEKLVEIGAASREELERAHAEHTVQRTNIESLRSRLEFLGVSRDNLDRLAAGQAVSADVHVPAPMSGVVTERLANVGLNVDPAAKLLTVVDLSTVWIVASLYEKDFARVRAGSSAVILSTAYPDRRLEGRVSYIDPQVDPNTRTAKVRVEVANPGRQLRPGMLAEVQIQAPDRAPVVLIPRSAVQTVSDRTVVFLAEPNQRGQFAEREVRLGPASGDRVEVVSGLTAGDRVVVQGSFSLRAERERVGLRPSGSGTSAGPLAPHSHGQATPAERSDARP